MKLNKLKPGMVCELRNKENIISIDGYLFTSGVRIFYLLERYNEGLTHKENKHLDVMEITYGDKVVFKRKESRWFVPEYDEAYFHISIFGIIISSINKQIPFDTDVLNNNRVFETREEAEKRLRQQQATLSVERWIAENDVEVDLYDTNVLKLILYYDVVEKEFCYTYTEFYVYMPKQFILSSEEKVEQLIKEREKELKIMFGVEEQQEKE